MTSLAYALARAGLIKTLTAYSGITTADGAFDGTATLIDSNLKGRNDFISEKTILIMSGDAKDEDKGATAFDNTDGKITLQGTGFSAQIKAGTIYRVLNISTVEIDVANMDAKIGTNTDATGTTTLFAWLAKLFASGERSILGNYGKVTTFTDTTHFKVSGLSGFGDDYFKDFSIYVVRDAGGAGAAPQGEMQPISDYVSSDGTFTHTTFTTPLAVDDEVLILHERVAEVKDLIDRLGAFTAAENLKTILGRTLFSMDFWSDMQEEVQLTTVAGDKTLPDVVIADLPTGATIVRATAMFKFRMVENTNADNPNNLVLDQYIQVRKLGQAFNNAIKMINTGFSIASATREGGDVIIGTMDIAGTNKVDANDTYNFQWTNADAAQDNLQFNDVQVGLRIWYSV